MALVGEMQYLTIGSNTYSLPSSGGSGTVTSVGVSNDTNGGLSISGSPVTSSGTITIGHSNVLTSAQSTQAVYPITIDKNGHIASYGNAVTIPSEELGIVALYDDTYSDISAAYNNYKYIIGYDGEGPMYLPLEKTEGGFTFTGIHKNGSDLFATEYTISSSGVWSNSSIRVDYMKWAASSSTNTYYPLVSSSASNTFTASTLNGINFYQYYNTAGGYRRLELGNATAYKSTGGAYGTIRLYGAAATYYGDLVPGTLGTTSGDGHISANRTWTLPDATGTIALTSNIPDVSGKIDTAGTGLSKSGTTLNHSNSITAQTTQAVYPIKIDAQGHISAYGSAVTVPTKVSDLTNDSGFVTTDEKLKVIGYGNPSTDQHYPILTTSTDSAETKYRYDEFSLDIIQASSNGGVVNLKIGSNTGNSSLGYEGRITLYGKTNNTYATIKPSVTAARELTLPDKSGTVALTDDIPTVPTITLNGSSTTSPSFYAPTGAGTSGYVLTSSGSGAPSWTSGELTDTKNTAGSTNSTSKLYLIGATSQAANPQTYSNSNLYYDSGLKCITSANSYNVSSTISQTATGLLLSIDDANNDYDSVLNLSSTKAALGVDNYNETYRLSVNTNGDIYAECIEFKIELDSTLDATLISDIANLGWTNDVIA